MNKDFGFRSLDFDLCSMMKIILALVVVNVVEEPWVGLMQWEVLEITTGRLCLDLYERVDFGIGLI